MQPLMGKQGQQNGDKQKMGRETHIYSIKDSYIILRSDVIGYINSQSNKLHLDAGSRFLELSG